VIPPSDKNSYCAPWGKTEQNVVILEAGPDVSFIIKTQMQMIANEIPTSGMAIKNLRILIIMTRKDKWKPNNVALFHGEINKPVEVPRASAGGMNLKSRRSSMFVSVQQLQGLNNMAAKINKKAEEVNSPSLTAKER